jgi:RimJ/RimL family protein N-acetyltransferase
MGPMTRLADVWAPAGIVVRTPRLELRGADEADLLELADLAARGVHDEKVMPFLTPWSRGTPDERRRSVLQWHWRCRGEWTPAKWSWSGVAVVDGRVVGTQGMGAEDYGVTRTAETGSWLGVAHQGQGLGKEMRAAILHLLFVGLDASRATTGAFDDNPPSLGVTRSLGYTPNGERYLASDGNRRRELLFTMDRADWEAIRRDDITLSGVEPARALFGLDPLPEPDVEAPVRTG